jgi:CheY-like chemotaxis protein
MADDDVDDCSLATEAFKIAHVGNPLRCLSDGEKLIDYLRDCLARQMSGACFPALILLDLNMPRMDGFELIRRVRGDARLSGTPIIVVSADTDPATPQRVADLGVSAFFPKPFSPTQIRRKLEQILDAATQ